MIKIGRFSGIKDYEAFSVRSLQKLGLIVSYRSVDYINLTFIWKWMKGLVLKYTVVPHQ